MNYQNWYAANKVRDYPFRGHSLLPTELVLDLQLSIPTQGYNLPILLVQVVIGTKTISFLFKDSLGEKVGCFNSDYPILEEMISIPLTSPGQGCDGLITLGKSSDQNPNVIALALPVELNCIRPVKVSPFQLSIKGIPWESGNLNLYPAKQIGGNTLEIYSEYTFTPKCEEKPPIKSINGVVPNAHGKIELTSIHDGLVINKIGDSILEVKSLFRLKDFDSHWLTNPRGESGDPGAVDTSTPPDGRIIEIPLPDPISFGTILLDGKYIYTKKLKCKKVVFNSNGKGLGIDDQYLYLFREEKGMDLARGKFIDITCDEQNNLFYVIDQNNDLLTYNEDGILQVRFPTGKKIISIHSWEGNLYYLTEEEDLFSVQTGEEILVHCPGGWKVKYPYVLSQTGKLYGIGGVSGLDVGEEVLLTDHDQGTLIGHNGFCYDLDTKKEIYLGTSAHLLAIDQDLIVGERGRVYLNKRRIGTPPGKEWSWVKKFSTTRMYFGGIL